VRLHTALALAFAKDRDAIPELIELLADLPADQAVRAEEVLLALAGEQAPEVGVGRDKTEREKARDAWADWWKKHGDKTDLAKLATGELSLGHTVVVQLDPSAATGRVVEYGRDGKVRWEITGLKSPRDAQLLPGGRVFVCEYGNRRLTERDQKGRVLWEHALPGTGVLVGAQRLANGNTFVATRNQLVEIDRDGKEVFSYKHTGSSIYAARKGRNGEIVYITLDGKCVRLDAKGNPVSTFNVGRTGMVGMDLLPNGNVVFPISTQNKVVEYDAKGRLVWEAPVERPIAAVRLPNGHVLVASSIGQYVVELDRRGKEVWKLPIEGRPMRAFRR
jgi:outer membrane protein assembly factor BamB